MIGAKALKQFIVSISVGSAMEVASDFIGASTISAFRRDEPEN
jgi:hypothetical protein